MSERLTQLLMLRDNGATLPEDLDLALSEIERLRLVKAAAKEVLRVATVDPDTRMDPVNGAYLVSARRVDALRSVMND